jgi:catechol 2,3-dioxygenase-like lactoylglutathione lyase family enzyme
LNQVDPERPGVTSFVHTGVVVEDLAAAVEFFTLLGLDCGSAFTVGGEWVERIIGLPDPQVEAVMVRTPDGTDTLELVKFHAPAPAPAPAEAGPAPANRPGIRHVAYKVGDLRAVVERLRAAGWDTVGDVVDYEGMFLLCYVRGPEGLIIELAEALR